MLVIKINKEFNENVRRLDLRVPCTLLYSSLELFCKALEIQTRLGRIFPTSSALFIRSLSFSHSHSIPTLELSS